ncbi:MAG: GGDEF domain-containing protein [Coriobacteriales bacterium]|nr:GGDEF domain-containing protein [Coriobacteriales bacterium]
MGRYRIGLMVGNKSVDYVHDIRMGIQNTLEESGHQLIAISDLIPFHSRTNTEFYFRVAFEIVSRLDLDAVIVPAGIIAGYLNARHASLHELLGILDPNKTLVIERELHGYRCVGKDGTQGMHECMRHLIDTCGYHQIGFIGGPESSRGAQEREEVYRQEMASHGLEVPSRLVVRGSLSGECGDNIDRLIDANPKLEAIVCCCDLIAHSVYHVMHQRGLAVGADIAVTGFDDLPMSAHMDPPLSTVHITGYDLGCMAARETMRICAGEPQRESVLCSRFVPRGSCGEDMSGLVERFGALLRQSSLPEGEIVDIFVEQTLSAASRAHEQDFHEAMRAFFSNARAAYHRHLNHPGEDDQLFSSQDLGQLFYKPYRDRISLEGFQSAAMSMLRALVGESGENDAAWIVNQISELHLGIARLLNVEAVESRRRVSEREWTSFHVIDDAVCESSNPKLAYRLMLEELGELGVRQADLFLLPEPVAFVGSRTVALSDTIIPIGRLEDGEVRFVGERKPVGLHHLLDTVIPADSSAVYTVGGIMAGHELVGVAAIDGGELDDDGQLIAFLNLGIALKHLQMIADERESNQILSQSNLVLERQSYYDEMTGALNRRGFMSKLERVMGKNVGRRGTLFYMDLDGLKQINDHYGHDAGDEAIRQTTRVLSACLPDDTILGRLGGDEFVAFTLAEEDRVMDSVGSSIDASMATFNATHSYPFDLSISYGGVCLAIADGSFDDINQTMMLADERLYQMKKHRGRGRRYAGM